MCRGCRQAIDRRALRLVIHAFVRPGRGTVLLHHLDASCIGTALAVDALGACGKQLGVGRGSDGANLDCAEEALAVLSAAAAAASRGRRGRWKVEHEVGATSKPIVRSMLGDLRRGELSGAKQEEDAVCQEAWVRAVDM